MSILVEFVIYGEPASKANSRRLVTLGGKPRFIKSKKALDYERTFKEQCPSLDDPYDGDVEVTLTIHYASRRPDLDESVILDCMQNFIYRNDRQVKVKHVYWALDKSNPRSEIKVETMG